MKAKIAFLIVSIFIRCTLCGATKPCASHGGPVRRGEGSGICTGNYHTSLHLVSVGATLNHDSLGSADDGGFGKGFLLSLEQWFTLNTPTTGTLYTGNGSAVKYKKSDSSDIWYALDPTVSDHTLKVNPTLVTETTLNGATFNYTKATNGNYLISNFSDLNSNSAAFARDGSGRLNSVSYDNGQSLTFTYSAGHVSKITDVGGNSYTLGYDTAGHLTGITFPGNRFGRLDYNNDFIAKITTPEGRVTELQYDGAGDLAKVKWPEGDVCNFSYTASSVNADCTHSAINESFGTKGILSRTIAGVTESWERDEIGRITKYISGLGEESKFFYNDSSFRVAKRTDSDGNTEEYTYNNWGRVLSSTMTVGSGNIQERMAYNALNLPAKFTRNSRETAFTYDSKGNLTSIKDWLGNQVNATYNSKGQTLSLSDGVRTTRYAYDAIGHLSSITYPNGRVTNLTTDQLGRLTQLNAPDSVTYNYSYASTLDFQSAGVVYNKGSKKEELSQTFTRSADGSFQSTSLWSVKGKTLIKESNYFDSEGRAIRTERSQ